MLGAATGLPTGYVSVVKVGNTASTRHPRRHRDRRAGLRHQAPPERHRPADQHRPRRHHLPLLPDQLGLDENHATDGRLEALFVLSVTLGLRPGELRKLSWDHVKLDQGIVHVWRSARTDRRHQDTEVAALPRHAQASHRRLPAHQKRQAAERQPAGAAWQDTNLVFCHEDGPMYTRDALNWRFSKVTRRAGIGHWHAHEGRSVVKPTWLLAITCSVPPVE